MLGRSRPGGCEENTMRRNARDIARNLLHSEFDQLSGAEQRVAQHLASGRHIARNVTREYQQRLTLGQRLADRVAAFGGSWAFIGAFFALMLIWIVLNSVVLLRVSRPFDPYPYILLNLFLSMLAAVQAPVILMSQNRQANKDRLSAEHDYEVNLKSELEITALHAKIDALREQQWTELIAIQQDQLRLLARLVDEARAPPAAPGAAR
jgi:uncharacterized membrane protein